jgi:alkylhydroperoxidase family enzyme
LPALSNEEAWRRLPPAEEGSGQPLPAWALILAGPLPRTTAALLELDYVQRAKSPLGPELRGRLRWTAARVNRCAYGLACAAADLRRAGLSAAEIQALDREDAARTEAERIALAFARKMMRAADTVTDAEFARLTRHYGDKQTVAIVLHLAYAAFQDRLLLYLGVHEEKGGPLPPLKVRFRKEKGLPVGGTARPDPAPRSPEKATQEADREWTALDFAQLLQKMESQRERPSRIRVPTWEELRKQGVPERPGGAPLRIRWSLVCLGYQRELAAPWSMCLGTFAAEAAQDRVLEESLFWVITRRLNCFY